MQRACRLTCLVHSECFHIKDGVWFDLSGPVGVADMAGVQFPSWVGVEQCGWCTLYIDP